jgi:hypothetical protein
MWGLVMKRFERWQMGSRSVLMVLGGFIRNLQGAKAGSRRSVLDGSDVDVDFMMLDERRRLDIGLGLGVN